MAASVWEKMYHAIYSCNNLTRLLQKKTDVVFVEGSREMMLAELKALRATLHYELVRLFHPQVTVDADAKGLWCGWKARRRNPCCWRTGSW